MRIKLKEKKPPKWFKREVDEANSVEKKLLAILGVSRAWLFHENRKSLTPAEILKGFNLSKENALRFRWLCQYHIAMKEATWAKYRLKNIENEWGQADHLTYNEKKNVLILHLPLFDYLGKAVLNALKRYEKSTKSI